MSFSLAVAAGALGACEDDRGMAGMTGGGDCPVGSTGCDCGAGGVCAAGLVCYADAGVCGPAGGSGGDDGGTQYDVGDGGGDGPGDGGTCNCAPKSDLIYLLGHNPVGAGDLWTFNPEILDFQKVGPLGCSAENVFSMGVSRDGKAWVQTYPSGDLFTMDVNSQQCGDPGFAPNPAFGNFGMAFVSESAANPCDKIHGVMGNWQMAPTECPGQACGRLGKMVGTNLEEIGPIDFFNGEMTGTGDGRLYAFVGASPAKLVQLDKTTAQIIETVPLTGLELTDAFAFAFWGGDFYFFTEANDTLPMYPEAPSQVHKLDYDNNEGGGLTVVVPSAPILVAGAGVSTCAPFRPPG